MKLVDDFINSILIVDPTRKIEVKKLDHGETLINFCDDIFDVVVFIHNPVKTSIVEIYVRKQAHSKSTLAILTRINELNTKHLDVTFFYDDQLLYARSFCTVTDGARVILQKLMSCETIAKQEFENI